MNMEISIVLAYGCLVLPPMQEMAEVKYNDISTKILTTKKYYDLSSLFFAIYIVFVNMIGMPDRIDSDTLFLHHLLHVYAFREHTHVFTCSIRCAQRWPYDKDASMNYG